MKTGKIAVIIVVAFCVSLIVTPQAAAQLKSPNQTASVEIVETPLPGADPREDFFTLILRRDGRIISRFPTYGYLLDAYWSSDMNYLAVNNRRANSGDYVWVFSLQTGKALKKPDDRTGVSLLQVARKFSDCNEDTFESAVTVTKGWLSPTRLNIETRLSFQNGELEVIHDAIYEIDRGKLRIVQEVLKRG